MWWQSLRKQLEAAVNGALSVSLLQSTPIPLFLSRDTAITTSLLFSVLRSPPTVFFTFPPPHTHTNSIYCNRSSPPLFPFCFSSLIPNFILHLFLSVHSALALQRFSDCPLHQCSLRSALGKLGCGHVLFEKIRGAGGKDDAGWDGGVPSSQYSREQGSCVKALTVCLPLCLQW